MSHKLKEDFDPMCNSIMNFIAFKDFDCKDAFRKPHYKFNAGERLGNFLLTPLFLVYKKFSETDSRFIKVGMIIVGLFAAAVIGLIGAPIKKLGEYANPQAENRRKAMNLFKEAHIKQHQEVQEWSGQPIIRCEDCWKARNTLASPTEQESTQIANLFNSIYKNPLERSKVNEALNKALCDLDDKSEQNQDTSKEEAVICQLAAGNQELIQANTNWINRIKQVDATFLSIKNAVFADYYAYVNTMPLVNNLVC